MTKTNTLSWILTDRQRREKKERKGKEASTIGKLRHIEKRCITMSEQNLAEQDGSDDLDGLLTMSDLLEFDMGTYIIKHLPGSERLYKLKMHRANHLMDTMATFRKEQRFCDVVLKVNDNRHPAHKVVLASASSYFASMFGQSGHIEARTTEDIDFSKLVSCPTVMDLILGFIYTSEVQLNDKTVSFVVFCSFMSTRETLCLDNRSFVLSNEPSLMLFRRLYEKR